ncbi:MAG: 23S rRNA (adenine(2503)-C(2))-methyltransferase RlmN [Bacteroidia bacterium]|nr:23S rRNA (adenine(2503)-C(2))-methyltransferase RlmN [Bacteroidia bacterium]MDW8235400.1 23S rRNA (adenine(2503)-C(2))-methyltransferase RlmN [Bacteroidia bacterium]
MVRIGTPVWTLRREQLSTWLREQGEPSFRMAQLEEWLWEKGVPHPNAMTDLPVSLRQKLEETFSFPTLTLLHRRKSQDGTEKFLWEMPEGGKVETVWIPHSGRYTICISSQVGCSLNCRFCATGQLGLERQLHGYEILLQLYELRHTFKLPITHVVFMGMGEPLLNYSAVMEALEGITHHLHISPRRITLSTVGIPKGIYRLTERKERFELALSLHSAIPEKRKAIIPLAAHISLSELREALSTYCQRKRDWITLEYVLLEGANDSDEDAEALYDFVQFPLQAKVNLIEYNPVPGLPYRPSPRMQHFQRYLLKRGLIATIRRSRGADIAAGCGQLARRISS